MTSGGLAENIRRTSHRLCLISLERAHPSAELHLLEFHTRELEHLRLISARRGELAFNSSLLTPLLYKSDSDEVDSYNDKPISDDFITDVWLSFSKQTREAESAEYMQSFAGLSSMNRTIIHSSYSELTWVLTGRVYSIDNTFKASAKATIVDGKNQGRTNIMKGGILTCIDENNCIDSWVRQFRASVILTMTYLLTLRRQRLCQSQANAELEELLRGIYNRHVDLELPMPEMFVADNCCHVRNAIQKIFPGAHVCLDVFHLLGR